MAWNYRVKSPGEKIRDPIQGEFFSTEAIKNPADALVREAIQNALDAAVRDRGGKPKDVVKVRFYLSTGIHALPGPKVAQWFGGAWEHFNASSNGLRERPQQTEPCPWLVFEDFGTVGLQGDINQSEPIDGVQNHFFYFFRAEGKSVEGGKERGRWGVGKYVFPRSSRANAFFGLSVRDDNPKRLLLGTSVFKSHRVGGKFYCPDGYFGIKDGTELVLPFTDDVTLDKFSAEFHLKRKNQTGLSIVMPWVDPEITAQSLIEAAVRGYFYPILTGALNVCVETPEKVVLIDDTTLRAVALGLEETERNDMLNLIELAEWGASRKPKEILKLEPCNPERSVWVDSLIPVDQLNTLQKTLERGEKVAVQATLTIRGKDKTRTESHFDLFLWKDGFESGRPVFIREGLIISDVRAPRARGIRSLVVIEAGPLGTLLGDAEGPAHTEWQAKGENFRGKYICGPAVLDFVTKAVSNFVHCLTSQDEHEDKALLLDIFSLPTVKTDDELKGPEPIKRKKGRETDGDLDPQEPRKRRFRVTKAEGGFTVTRGDAGTRPPARLEIKCAYDGRGKNPLSLYRKSIEAKSPDFQIGRDGIDIIGDQSIELLEARYNLIRVAILDQDFRLTVSGFDKNRDLFVTVKMEEGSDDSQV